MCNRDVSLLAGEISRKKLKNQTASETRDHTLQPLLLSANARSLLEDKDTSPIKGRSVPLNYTQDVQDCADGKRSKILLRESVSFNLF
jgi:hypothetical protein